MNDPESIPDRPAVIARDRPRDAGPGGPFWQLIVLSWNGRDDTLACLESLSRIKRSDVGIICVDNGSADGSAQAVRSRYPEVFLIESETNLGYSGGNNLGIRHALEHGASWIVLVNNDATVAADVIEGFERAISQRPRAGLLAGKIYFAETPLTIWFAGQRISTRLGYSGRARGYRRVDGARYAAVVETDRAAGALMAISAKAVAAVGLLDEELFAYVEDVEFAIRVRDAGFEVVVAPGARAWHRVSASTGGESESTHTLYYGVRNTIVVLERRRPLGAVGTALRRVSILTTFTLHALTRAKRRPAVAAVWEGFADARARSLGPRRHHGNAPLRGARARR